MDERELSKLAYLAAALVRASPRGQRLLFGLHFGRWAKEFLIAPSPALGRALAAMRQEFAAEFREPGRGSPRQRVERIAIRLGRSDDEALRAAGRSLQWAIEIL